MTTANGTGSSNTTVDTSQTQLVPATLPGLGETFLDQSMVPKVDAFIANAAAHGVALHFNSAYRTPEHQAALHHDSNAVTPADQSLHSAGFAVDVNYSSLPADQREVIRNAAASAGLSWGGDFRTADPPHFYVEPPIDRAAAIANAARQYQEQIVHQTQPARNTAQPAPASSVPAARSGDDAPSVAQPSAAARMPLPQADGYGPQLSAMYLTLKEYLPRGTSEARLVQGAAACYMAGIKSSDLSGIYIGDTDVTFTSSSLFARPAHMDISQPAPHIHESMQKVLQFDQAMAQVQSENRARSELTNRQI
jgi:hypothetical protein